MADARKEQCSRIGGGAVLAEETQMVASEKGLQAHADVPITMVLTQLDGLVHIAVSVAQIRRLRVAEVNAQTLGRTGEDKSSQYARHTTPQSNDPQSDRVRISKSHRPTAPPPS